MHKTVKCPLCDFEILILPDTKAMTKAIMEHATTHGDENRFGVGATLVQATISAVAEEFDKFFEEGKDYA